MITLDSLHFYRNRYHLLSFSYVLTERNESRPAKNVQCAFGTLDTVSIVICLVFFLVERKKSRFAKNVQCAFETLDSFDFAFRFILLS